MARTSDSRGQGKGGTLSASWTNEPRVSMFRFDWDSERKKAPCV